MKEVGDEGFEPATNRLRVTPTAPLQGKNTAKHLLVDSREIINL